MRSALSDKVLNGELILLDAITMAEPKTKAFAEFLHRFEVRNALVVLDAVDENIAKSARNIQGVEPVEATGINVYNILAHGKLIMTKDAVAKVEEVLG